MLDYDREAAHYDATRGGDARASAAAEAIEVLLRQAGGGAARIADLACGTGIVTVRLARPGRSVTGIDRSAGMAAVAAGGLPGRIAVGDVTRLPLAAGSADAVTMVWLLHLLSAAACVQAMAEAARVLRPGGLLITTAGKNDAEFAPPAGDATAILAPVRARFGRAQTDAMDRVPRAGRTARADAGGADDLRRDRPGTESPRLAQAARRGRPGMDGSGRAGCGGHAARGAGRAAGPRSRPA